MNQDAGHVSRRSFLGSGILYAAGVASTAWCAFASPFANPLLNALSAGLAGALAAWIFQLLFRARTLSLAEVLQSFLVTALFSASADGALELWKPAATWSGLLVLKAPTSSLCRMAYLGYVAYRLARAGRHVPPVTAASLASIPYLLNVLFLLLSPVLLREMGTPISSFAGLGPAVARCIGSWITLFVFQEALAGIIHLLLAGRFIRDGRLHLLLAASALFTVLTPHIADAGSAMELASWPKVPAALAAVSASILSQAGLWAQIYLLTGMMLNGLRNRKPSIHWGWTHYTSGLVKGAVYSGVFMGLVHGAGVLLCIPIVARSIRTHPGFVALLSGAVLFPLLKTLIETFDDSAPFFSRLSSHYRDPSQALRGTVIGAGIAGAIAIILPQASSWARFLYGFGLGSAAFAGVDLIWDGGRILRRRDRRRFETWRVYALGMALGGLMGGAAAWYLDALQISVVYEKFRQYSSIHFSSIGKTPEAYVIYPLFSKWGAMDLGTVTGGARLFYSESLSGVIQWSLAAPLFSLNLVGLAALFQRSLRPVRQLFTREGMVGLAEQAVRVQRWGLWMAPLIYTFLRMSPNPSWYNQDGAIRTAAAIWKNATLDPNAFRAWSLGLFIQMLAYDWLRIVIWFDHMGLRVATLVNLSFIGGDFLDERSARFIGHTSRTRCLPDAVRRFATWAPLLIPFYLPRGRDWDVAWVRSQEMQAAAVQGFFTAEHALLLVFLCVAACAGIVLGTRRAGRPRAADTDGWPSAASHILTNGVYTLELSPGGRGHSRVFRSKSKTAEIDLTRRVDDPLQLWGRTYYLLDADIPEGDPSRIGSLPGAPVRLGGTRHAATGSSSGCLRFETILNGIQADVDVRLADDDPVELWRVRLTNLEDRPRSLELSSFRELVLNDGGFALRNGFFNGMHIGTCFVRSLGAIFATNRLLKDPARHAVDRRPSRETAFHAVREATDGTVRLIGYEDSRPHFIGAETLRYPACLERPIRDPADEGCLYTLDPVASLRVSVLLGPKATCEVLFADGYTEGPLAAARLIERVFALPRTDTGALDTVMARYRRPHGFVYMRPAQKGAIAGSAAASKTGSRVFSFSEDHTELRLGWDTPQPWGHILANEAGYGAICMNDGNVFSFMGNSQQNGLTPFHTDSMPIQVPGQVLYLTDLATGRTLSPGYVPFREPDSDHSIAFGRGYVVYRKKGPHVETDLTAFVVPDEPVEVRILKIRNSAPTPATWRVVPYFQMVLGETPADTRWKVEAHFDRDAETLFFSNPHNDFRAGQAFVAMSIPVDAHETMRSRFVGGPDMDLANPFMVEHGAPDETQPDDGLRVAAMAGTLDVPSGGECEVVFVMGQAADMNRAERIVREYRNPRAAVRALDRTKRWWHDMLSVLTIETENPSFDALINHWLPYQVLVARLWGRCGRRQRSGGYGFRDQLQDVLPFVGLHPRIARKQILMNGARQFVEGDVMQWWHETRDGKPGLGARNRASDPQLWLPYVAAHYVRGAGDRGILDEEIPYLEGKPIARGADGTLIIPRLSREVGTLYEHCVRAIDFTLRRLGRNGLPLIGTGDWNDGLSAVGARGKGESTWLGFFLHDVLVRFSAIAADRGDASRGEAYLHAAGMLREALGKMWRDGRYVRAITDDGREMVFADALTASWPLLSGAADLERGLCALNAGLAELEKENLVLLLSPPFTEDSPIFPGKIADYPPGIRENGGQYSHGASWLIDALVAAARELARAGRNEEAAQCRERAVEVWMKISPLKHTSPENILCFGLAPHQQAADIYYGSGYEGVGGWAWYTGAAARMLCAAYAMLGIGFEDGDLRLSEDIREPRGPLSLKRLVYRGREYAPPG